MSHFGPPYKKPCSKSWRDVAEDAAEERGFARIGREADAIMLAVGRVVDHFAVTAAEIALFTGYEITLVGANARLAGTPRYRVICSRCRTVEHTTDPAATVQAHEHVE